MNTYETFIAKSRYSRFLDDKQRREHWPETVDRYMEFIDKQLSSKQSYIMPEDLYDELHSAILNREVMPSMRAVMTAGEALDRDNTAGYNCSYLPVDSPRSFDEAMYILMCGTGVGFSVERENVDKLPIISENMQESDVVIKVEDSKAGWAKAYRELVALLYSGMIPTWDVSKVRPSGARLKVMGGRASGSDPLVNLFKFTVEKFKSATGRKLFPVECHDIMCKVGEVVVVGGVRRSALISLSNLNDDQMAHAKTGQWWESQGQRALANNSVAYKGKPSMETYMREWLALYESKSGERGMFNRQAADEQVAKSGRRQTGYMWGTNPCSEIILRPYQFCNLSEVVVRENDDLSTLRSKVRIATMLGTFQSTLTDLKYLRKIWKTNTEEERLLGVSLTGIMDHPVLARMTDSKIWLQEMKQVAIDTNREYAEKIGIPRSTAITCVKPSGTVSQLTDSASGIHARHNPFYIRTVRGDNKDPLTQFMKEEGIPFEADITKPDSVTVFSFPMKSPSGAITRTEMSAIEQLELWKLYALNWCEHKPSVTISVKEEEWMEVGSWLYDNFDIASGVSFLPFSDHTYQQAPYQDIEADDYLEWNGRVPSALDWTKFSNYEKEDNTSGSRELACTADACEVVDLSSS